MKVVALSDTHQWHKYKPVMPKGDLLAFAGDACLSGSQEEFESFAEWWNGLNYDYKVFVPGNHDWFCQNEEKTARAFMSGTYFLIDQGVEIAGKKIYGSPWQPEFCNWAFNVPRGELKPFWDEIPTGLDLLITHGPPMGICDTTSPKSDEHLGDRELAERLFSMDLKDQPMRHIFGHIHGGSGMTVRGGIHFHNVAICDEAYRPVHPATEVEI